MYLKRRDFLIGVENRVCQHNRPIAEIGLFSPVFQSPSQPLVQIKCELMVKSTQLGFNPTLLSANYKSVMGAKLFG